MLPVKKARIKPDGCPHGRHRVLHVCKLCRLICPDQVGQWDNCKNKCPEVYESHFTVPTSPRPTNATKVAPPPALPPEHAKGQYNHTLVHVVLGISLPSAAIISVAVIVLFVLYKFSTRCRGLVDDRIAPGTIRTCENEIEPEDNGRDSKSSLSHTSVDEVSPGSVILNNGNGVVVSQGASHVTYRNGRSAQIPKENDGTVYYGASSPGCSTPSHLPLSGQFPVSDPNSSKNVSQVDNPRMSLFDGMQAAGHSTPPHATEWYPAGGSQTEMVIPEASHKYSVAVQPTQDVIPPNQGQQEMLSADVPASHGSVFPILEVGSGSPPKYPFYWRQNSTTSNRDETAMVQNQRLLPPDSPGSYGGNAANVLTPFPVNGNVHAYGIVRQSSTTSNNENDQNY